MSKTKCKLPKAQYLGGFDSTHSSANATTKPKCFGEEVQGQHEKELELDAVDRNPMSFARACP